MDSPKIFRQWNLKTYKDMFDFFDGQRSRLKCGKNEIVLDIGCGPGDLTSKLVPSYFPPGTRLIGSDISQEMVTYAQVNYSNEMITFKQLDIGSDNIWNRWEKESVNKIISIYVLHWVPNLRQAMVNMYSLLKENGAMFLLLPSQIPFMTILGKIGENEEFMQYTKGAKYFHIHSTDYKVLIEDYTKMLKDIGFREVDVINKEKCFHYSCYEALYDAVRSLDPYLKDIPENLRERYSEVIQNIAYNDKGVTLEPESGFVRIDYRLTYIYARK
uniref:Juvenile hormone acid O-methyltransferase-like protein n=1 Tax=Pyrrhocoris apterus TaxID=37000 RepID=A0A8K1XME8_PYRAP|nr:juvenile hormone acid O-methyltransferase-like protein [Pyrrhocoris apterus]